MRAREAREAQRKRLWGSGTHVTVNPNPSPQTTCHGPPYFLSMPSLIIFAAICSGETARQREREERRFAQGRARGAGGRRRPARAPTAPRGKRPGPPPRPRTHLHILRVSLDPADDSIHRLGAHLLRHVALLLTPPGADVS